MRLFTAVVLHSSLRSFVLSASLGVAVAAWGVDSSAAPDVVKVDKSAHDRAQVAYQEALKLYKGGQYRAAVDKLLEARKLDPTAKELPYNLGILYEKLGELDNAIKNFELLLTLETDKDELERIKSIVQRLKGARDDLARSKPSAEPPPPPPATSSAPVDDEPPPAPSATASAVRRRGKADGLFYGAGGLAVAGLGVGVIFGVKALIDKPVPRTGSQTIGNLNDAQSKAHTNAQIADVGFGVAILSGGAAALLYFLRDAPEAPPPASAFVAPLVGGGMAGFSGRFLKARIALDSARTMGLVWRSPMAHSQRSSWSSWLRRTSGFVGLSLLVACQVLVPASIDEIECTEENRFGGDTCPTDQICKAQKCVPCGVGECVSCNDDFNCAPSFMCAKNQCIPRPCPGGGTNCTGGSGMSGAAGSTEGGAGGEPGGGAGEGGSGDSGQAGAGQAGISGAGAAGCVDVEGGCKGGQGGSSGAGQAGQGGAGSGGSVAGSAGGGAAGQAGAGTGGAGEGGAGSGGTAPKPPGKLGEECGDKDTCQSGLECRLYADWKKAGPTATVCTSSCCESSACAPGFVCMPTVDGGRCLSVEIAGREVGTKGRGLSCTSGSECRSGWCGDGLCRDLCCKDNCAGDQAMNCHADTIPQSEFTYPSCKASNKITKDTSSCDTQSVCPSGVCYSFFCATLCQSNDDCPPFVDCKQGDIDGASFGYCQL